MNSQILRQLGRLRPEMMVQTGRLMARSPSTETVVWKRFFHPSSPRPVVFTYIEPDGTEKQVDAAVGTNLMQVAHDNNIELEGACGGELACSTCHLIFEKEIYDTLPTMDGEEEDMLDLAFEVTET